MWPFNKKVPVPELGEITTRELVAWVLVGIITAFISDSALLKYRVVRGRSHLFFWH